jgi:hypothetical protein
MKYSGFHGYRGKHEEYNGKNPKKKHYPGIRGKKGEDKK